VLSSGPLAADELRERQLESKVNQLEREISALERRLEQLERARATRGATVTPGFQARPEPESPAWLVSANWDRIKPGMALPDVIAVLGRPTSTRTGEGTGIQLLMYAMEIGAESILAGSVAMGSNGVTEVHRPVLR
jgi:hypothetical protein